MAINWLAIVVAAIAEFAIGAGWYGALFVRQYRELQASRKAPRRPASCRR